MGNKGGKAGGGPKPATIQKLVEATNFSAAEVSSLWNTFVSIKEEMEAGAGGAASAAAAAHGDLRISSAEFQAALGFRRGAPGGGESVFLGRIFGLFDENKDGYISFEEASAGCGGRICVRRCMGGGRSPRARGGARAVSGAAQWSRGRAARARGCALRDCSPSSPSSFSQFVISISTLTPTAKPEARVKRSCALRPATRAPRTHLPAIPATPSGSSSCSSSSSSSSFTHARAVAFDLYDSDKRGAISPADVTYLLAASFRENGAVIADAAVARIVAETFRQYDVNRDGLLDFAEFRHMCTLQPNVLRPLTLNVSEMIAAHAGDAK